MTQSDPLRRRGFLSRLAAGTAALGAAAGIPVAVRAQQQARQTHELDKWIDELRGQHKQVFDCVTRTHIAEMQYASNFLRASVSDYGLKNEDMSVIVSFRHEATPYGYNDAMWDKYKLGEHFDIAARGNGAIEKATSNPQLPLITSLVERGVHFSVCLLSTGRIVGELARKFNAPAADIRADILANLVTNCHPVAAGVVLLNRAQERGFSYLHVG